MNQTGNLIETLLSYNNGAVVRTIAEQVGIPESAARGAIGSMAPSLSRGIERNISDQGGLTDLLNALQTGNHQRYVDNPEVLAAPESISDGNAILGHILGSKDVSRNVAAFSGRDTGVTDSILKQMLPMVAAAAMGALAKRVTETDRPAQPSAAQAAPDIAGVLSSFLDTNKDGSALDEILGMAKIFFTKR